MTSCSKTSFFPMFSCLAKQQLSVYKVLGKGSRVVQEEASRRRLPWHCENHPLALDYFDLSMELLQHSYQRLQSKSKNQYHTVLSVAVSPWRIKMLTSCDDGQGEEYYWKEWKVVQFSVYLLRLPAVETGLYCCDSIYYEPYILLQPPQPSN